MITIWKYVYDISTAGDGPLAVDMPYDSEIVAVGPEPSVTAPNLVCFWAKVNDERPRRTRKFIVRGTGHPLPENMYVDYLGTVVVQPFAWHLFEVKGE